MAASSSQQATRTGKICVRRGLTLSPLPYPIRHPLGPPIRVLYSAHWEFQIFDVITFSYILVMFNSF